MEPITVGSSIYCWPERHEPAPDDHPYYLEGADGQPALRCHGVICGIAADRIAVHYYLPDGSNGSCELPLAPAAEMKRGHWWWPPRT